MQKNAEKWAKALDKENVLHIIACGLAGLRACGLAGLRACGLAGLRAALFSLCAILFAACDGIGTSVRGNFELYGDGTTPSASGSSSDVSAGYFSTGDLLALSTAGDAETIVQLFLGVKGRDASSPVGMVTVSLPAAVIKLPAGGRVTLTITGGGLNYEDTAEASDDGMIYFQVPKVQSGSVVKVRLTVKKANGRLYCSGSKTQTVSEDSSNFDVALKYEPIPVSMLTGLQINAALKGAFSVTAGGTARSFRPSQTPPPAGTSTTLLSAPDSECELFAWQEGDVILFYAEGMEGDGKIPLSADSASMFDGCSGFTSIDLSCFDTSSITTMSLMFRGCSGLTSLDLSNFNTSSVTAMTSMFSGCSGLTSLNLSNFNTVSVTNTTYMFYGCSSLTSLNLSSFNTSNVDAMSSMFYGCSSLTSLNLSNFNTSSVTLMRNMFNGCSGLTSLNLTSFNTSSVTAMENMFRSCSSLTSLNLSNFNTGNVTNMRGMFSYCSALTSLNLNSFNTSNVNNMENMFVECSNLTTLDVSSFATNSVTNMVGMFGGCSGLVTIYASSGFGTSAVTSSSNMFNSCSNLSGSNGTTYNPAHKDAEYALIDGTGGLPGYFTLKP